MCPTDAGGGSCGCQGEEALTGVRLNSLPSLAVFLTCVTFAEPHRDCREADTWPVEPLLKHPKRHNEGVALEPSVSHRSVWIYVLLFAVIQGGLCRLI